VVVLLLGPGVLSGPFFLLSFDFFLLGLVLRVLATPPIKQPPARPPSQAIFPLSAVLLHRDTQTRALRNFIAVLAID
jgi:hypothetical protein